MISLLFFLVGLVSVFSHIPMEFRKYIESKLIINHEDYPLFKEPLKSGIKAIFLKKSPKKKNIINHDNPPGKPVYVDEIIHYEISTNHPKYFNVSAFEDDFRNLLAMRDFKYVYKRDAFWRTWRQVEDESVNKTILTYRAENNNDRICAACHNRGYWAVEEGPVPCPYEIFSMKDENNVCVTEITHFAEDTHNCTHYTQSKDLKNSCNNPIVTQWRFSKIYKVHERKLSNSSVICEGREKCEITTIYQFQPDHIIFRIVNEENAILYSRIMKNDEKNYACVDECGFINIDTFVVQKSPTISKLVHFNKVQNNEHHGKDADYKQNENKDIDRVKGRIDDPIFPLSCESCNTEDKLSKEIVYRDEKPIIDWKSRGFRFKNTVNERYFDDKTARKADLNSDKGTPIARSGDRLSIKGDINNNFLDDLQEIETTTKLHCKNIIRDDDKEDDDVSSYAYYFDDEKRKRK